jgi:hypothetical protein
MLTTRPTGTGRVAVTKGKPPLGRTARLQITVDPAGRGTFNPGRAQPRVDPAHLVFRMQTSREQFGRMALLPLGRC